MSDLFEGRTMTEAHKFISGGAEYTLTLGFDADKVDFYNLSDWTGTAAGVPICSWFKGQTTAAHVYQQVVIDSSAGASFNFLDTATNGFTVANTSGGVAEYRTAITGITQADPCVVTAVAHGLTTGEFVRITDLGPEAPTARGMNEVDGQRYAVTVLTADTVSLQDPITGEDIDSSAYVAYVEGGSINLITRTQAYSTEFAYDPIVYKLTCGTSVMGTDNDVYVAVAYKWGKVIDHGDIG